MERLTRRNFLKGALATCLATGLAGLAINKEDNSQLYSQNIPTKTTKEGSETKYTIIARRPIIRGMKGIKEIETVVSEFGVDSEVWESLPKGLTQQQLYNRIVKSKVKSSTITSLNGVPVIDPGPIDNEDIYNEFLNGAGRYIKNPHPELDPKLEFTEQDKKTLEELLKREIKSPLVRTKKPFFGKERQVYLFPPQSRIYLNIGNRAPSIEIQANENQAVNPPQYNPSKISNITNKEEQEVFEKFMRFMILTEDSALQSLYGKEIKRPIDNFYYRAYLGGKIFK